MDAEEEVKHHYNLFDIVLPVDSRVACQGASLKELLVSKPCDQAFRNYVGGLIIKVRD